MTKLSVVCIALLGLLTAGAQVRAQTQDQAPPLAPEPKQAEERPVSVPGPVSVPSSAEKKSEPGRLEAEKKKSEAESLEAEKKSEAESLEAEKKNEAQAQARAEAEARARAVLSRRTFAPPGPHAVPTFHSIGLYWAPGGNAVARVEFKEKGAAVWRRGLDLWYDARNSEYRGSLVELRPGTTYDIRITRSGASGATLTATTWSENFPPGHTVTVPSGTTRIVIRPAAGATPTSSASSGTLTVNAPTASAGFTKITAKAGNNVIVGSASDACIEVEHGARNIIITGLHLRDCRRFGVLFSRGSSSGARTEHIVIEGNEFSGWGGFDASEGYPFTDGAIQCNFDGPSVAKPRRVIIQRNIFRDPRHPSTYWNQIPAHPHPEGPQALFFFECGENHVLRYNELHAEGNGNHFNDGFGGGENFRTEGSPGADSDIYGNRISHVYDDAIEAEGGNRNVRIWGNYIDRSMVAIGNAATVIGPLYVWRNVSNDMALKLDPKATDEGVSSRGPFVKAASNSGDPAMNGGRAYYFHNTLLQPPSRQSQRYPRGAAHAIIDNGGSQPLYNFVSLNNIWHIHHPGGSAAIHADCDLQATCTADYDLVNGSVMQGGTNSEPHGWGNVASGDESSVPTYASSNGHYPSAASIPSASNRWSGNFQLARSSLGYGAAFPIFNFNDQYSEPDVGAHQSGTAPMEFGVTAGLNRTRPSVSAKE